MTALIITIHVIACTLLIIIILIQRGRGGGLAESFSGVESMFGTKTNTFLTRTTTVLSIVFFVTCLSLALLSVRQSRSLMRSVKPQVTPIGQKTPAPAADNTAKQTQQQVSEPEKKATAEQAQGAPKTE